MIALFLTPFLVSGQSYWDWWNNLHDYPNAAGPVRKRYINLSPGYMGPNALPVLRLMNGSYDENLWLDVQGAWHGGNGDKTENIFIRMNIPVAKDRVNLYFFLNPYEKWETNAQVRDERRMMNLAARGNDFGDLLFGVNFFLLNEEKHFINASMNIEVKTTLGSGLSNARYTDHGMYTYSGHIGRTLIQKERYSFLLKSMAGFVTWQTNMNRLPGGSSQFQNDAFLFGLGFEGTYGKWEIDSDFSGYSGYIGNRDNPLFWRSQIQYNMSRLGIRAEYEYGLRWWAWDSIKVGIRYQINKSK